MSLPEQGAKVAVSVIDALKAQPMMLVLILFNAVIFGAIVYAVQSQRSNEHKIVQLILEKCLGK